ncbi:hypothetical protein M3Y97_01069000 [Aphelenchoides bicaudatus]|nr:hypothetical protein M3Y97_01069000 [Aphelenchoides bicaudatus]
MPELLDIFWVFDFFTTFMGIVLNALLIYTIVKTSMSTKMLPKYSYSFLTTSSFDFVVASVEMMTAHQVKIRDGIIFVMPQGIERHFSGSSILFFSLHCFVGYNSLFLIPVMYRFRYSIMREASNDKQKDWSACFATYTTFICGNIATGITAYYIYKTWKHMNSNVMELSANARSMQAQFSRSLIAQTMTTLLFAILPIGLMSSALVFYLDYKFLGTGILLPFNSMPAINALVTLYLVKVYRRFVLQLFMCGKKEEVAKKLAPSASSFALG